MIRLYFDTNVINGIHSNEFPELHDFLKKHRDKFLIPFSPAHVSDKEPSKEVKEELFWKDLDFITEFTESKFIQYDETANTTRPFIATSREVYESIEENQHFARDFDSMDKILDFVKMSSEEMDRIDLFDGFQNILNQEAINVGFSENFKGETFKHKLDFALKSMFSIQNDATKYKESDTLVKEGICLPNRINSIEENVLVEINEYLANNTPFSSIHELINIGLNKDEKSNYLYFSSAYLTLNLIGYQSDKIDVKRNKGFKNHLQDAIHSFYGGNCDYFITKDKKLIAKTKVLYELFGINTKIVHPNELVCHLENNIFPTDLIELIQESLEKEPFRILTEDNTIKRLYRLNKWWLNYFTHLQIDSNVQANELLIVLTKMNSNLSDLMFYEEHDSVIKSILAVFGSLQDENKAIERFNHANIEERYIEFQYSNLYLKLNKPNDHFYFWIQITKQND